MEYVNFVFGMTEVEINGVAHDLHNFYDFKKIQYDLGNKVVVLTWHKKFGAPKEEPNRVDIEFKDVCHFSTVERGPKMPFSEDSCLLSMLFVAEQDKTESAFYDDFPSSDLHCIFQFHSGFKIRVFAAEVRCNIGT